MHTKARQELLVASMLEATHRLTVYLPQARQQRGAHFVQAALFPGYLFVQVDLTSLPASQIDNTPGAIRLVAFGGQPQTLPDETVESLQQRVAELDEQGGLPRHPFRPGDSVRFTDGPLRGLEGVFQGPMRPAQRVRVLMQFLGSLHEMEVDADDLEKATDDRPNRPPRRTRGNGRTIRQHD